MKPFRALTRALLLFAGAGILVLLALGLVGVSFCEQCRSSSADAQKVLLIVAGAMLMAASAVLHKNQYELEFLWLTGLASIASLAFLSYMALTGDFCPLCAAFHSVVILLAVSAVEAPRLKFLAPAAVLLVGSLVWAGRIGPTPRGDLALRDWESVPLDGPIYVVFTDPECPHCHRLTKQILSNPSVSRERVIFRWFILNRGSDRKVRAAAICETLWSQRNGKGDAYLLELSQVDGEIPEKLLRVPGGQAQTEPDARGVQEAIPPDALSHIAADGQIAKELGISSVPTAFGIERSKGGKLEWTRIDSDRLLSLLRKEKTPVKEDNL